MAKKGDWLALVEAAYRMDLAGAEWTRHLAETMATLRGDRFGVLSYLYDIGEGHLAMKATSLAGVPEPMIAPLVSSLEASPPDGFMPFFTAAKPFGTASGNPELRGILDYLEGQMGDSGIHDSYGLVARVSWRHGVVIGVNLPERRTVDAAEMRRLTYAASHVAASARLREVLGPEGAGLEGESVDAVLTPDGKVRHASGAARETNVREQLREAALRIDRARGALRSKDSDEALGLWHGLVDGRWSLIDHFDHDGRRFLVAHRNPGEMRDPRALTERERQVAHEVSLGRSNAEAAYALGLASSTVAKALSSVLRKLALPRRIDLVRLASAPVREALIRAGSDELLVRLTELPDEEATMPPGLTEAEQEVLAGIRRGLTNRAIAAERDVAERTVANQVASLLRKTGTGSREELVARLVRPADDSSPS